MPKSVERLIIEETDAIKIRDIIAGRTPAGDAIKKRALSVALLSQGKQIKDVASEVGLRENTVTEIRRRYLREGFDSLRDRARSGRPAKHRSMEEILPELDEYIANYEAEHGKSPSARVLSNSLGCSENTAREALAKRGHIQTRKHSWEILTTDTFQAKTIDLVGIYLSNAQQVLVVKADDSGVSGADSSRASLRTSNRQIVNALSQATGDQAFVQLADALGSFSKVKTRSSYKSDVSGFVRTVIEENQSNDTSIYHLLACGSEITNNSRDMLPGTRVEYADDTALWLARTECLFDILCTDANNAELPARLMSGIEMYLRHTDDQREAFIWVRSSHSTDRSIAATNSGRAAGPDPMPGTLKITARIVNDDRQWITYQVQTNVGILQKDFDLSSPESYLRSADVVEKVIAAASHDAARGINEAYLSDAVKKNR